MHLWNEKRRIAMAAGVVGLAAIGLLLFARGRRIQAPPRVAVMEVDIAASAGHVVAEGTVVPGAMAYVTPLPAMRDPVAHVYVQVGSQVTKGQVLADIEPIAQRAALDKAKAGLRAARATLDKNRSPHRPEQLRRAEFNVQVGRQRLAEEQAALDLLRNGSDPQEVANAAAEVMAAKARLEVAKKKYAAYQRLFREGAVARLQVDQAEADVAVARANLLQAEGRLELLRRGARSEQIRKAQARVGQARAALGAAQQDYALLRAGPRGEEVAEAAEKVRQMAAEVRYRTELVRNRRLRAPISGIVVARNVNPGEIAAGDATRAASAGSGATIAPSRSLFVIADDKALEFLANVDQRFLHEVRAGQAASVQIESLPGRTFAGKVVRVNPVVSPGTIVAGGASAGAAPPPLTFPAWIRLYNPDKLLASGQTGFASLVTAPSGIVVPQSAVITLAPGQGVVYLEEGGYVRMRSVRFGEAVGADGLRVLSGLSPDDRVVISDSRKLANGMRVRSVLARTDPEGMAPLERRRL